MITTVRPKKKRLLLSLLLNIIEINNLKIHRKYTIMKYWSFQGMVIYLDALDREEHPLIQPSMDRGAAAWKEKSRTEKSSLFIESPGQPRNIISSGFLGFATGSLLCSSTPKHLKRNPGGNLTRGPNHLSWRSNTTESLSWMSKVLGLYEEEPSYSVKEPNSGCFCPWSHSFVL